MPKKNRTASGVLGGLAGLVGLSAVAGILITATVTPAIAVSGYAASSAISMFDNMPSYLQIDKLMLPTTIWAKNPDTGQDQVLTQFYDQNRSPVQFDEVATVMYDALLSSEDKNFYQHGGIDLVGTASAVLDNIKGTSSRGGSSISQQYVKNVLIQRCEATASTDDELAACWSEATNSDVGSGGLERKLQEMRYAIQLEKDYTKNEILLGYLNTVNFGSNNAYGIDAAARYYFNVSAKDLNLNQAATLAGMVQNPSALRLNNPSSESNGEANGYAVTKERRDYVLDRLLADGKITQQQHDETVAAPITPQITTPGTGCIAAVNAEYFCQYVKGIVLNDAAFGETYDDRYLALRRGGLNIYTTLDWHLQNEALTAMRELAPSYVDGISFGAAAVNVEASTGRVLSMVQNTNFSEDQAVTESDASYSSLVYAANKNIGGSIGFNAGSTFKLFTLVDWLEKGHSVNEVLNGRTSGTVGTYTNSCTGNTTLNGVGDQKIDNFGGGGGSVGTVMSFTASSLNTGFAAMAKQLDLCDIAKVATRMGVTFGEGPEKPITVEAPYSILGPQNVSPLAMAGAYATIANNGTYCQPKSIDRVTDADGADLPIPATTCTEVIAPNVAATVAFALKGVMNGGTGGAGNPYDGTQLIGKTGTHQDFQTWMIESSTKVTTAVVVGTTKDQGNITRPRYNGRALNQIRFPIAERMQATANAWYGGDAFPAPDSNLTKTVLKDLPSVVGMTIDQATKTLDDAGFSVSVGDAVDSTEGAGLVAVQNPGAGKVAGGSTVTLNPSNGNGAAVPDVSGSSPSDAAAKLASAGFTSVQTQCGNGGNNGPGNNGNNGNSDQKVTGTNPAAGTVVGRGTTITILC